MPRPHEVNPRNFTVSKVLYNAKGFSIVYGQWQDGNYHLAMRWDGEPGQLGFPQSFGNPTWLLLPDELSVPITKALLDTGDHTDKKEVLALLQRML